MEAVKIIVSANYRKRDSPFRWLIRNDNQNLSETQPFKFIKATNIEFKKSNQYEYGFGCMVVAYCDSAKGYNENLKPLNVSNFIRIHFNGRYFSDSFGNKISCLSEMYLDKRGTILGILKEE